MPTKCVTPHMLENSECCSHTHTMLLTRNPRFTQQTLMQPLYVTLFIMLRGYRDSFQIAGAKNATQQIRNRLGAPTRKVSSSDGITISEGQERKMLNNLYEAKTAYRWSRHKIGQGLNDSNKLQQIINPFLVSIIPVSLTFHGQFDELRSPHRPFLVSIMTNFGTQLVQKTHKLRSKPCKFYKNQGQNNTTFAPLRYCYAVTSHSFSLVFSHKNYTIFGAKRSKN